MADGVLKGQVAIVTGGAGLIGSAISRRFAAEGATAVINGRDQAKADALAEELVQQGYKAYVHIANIRDEAEVTRMVEWTVSDFGRVDILINNAGGVGNTGGGKAAYIRDMTLENWTSVLDLNLTAAFLCSRAVFPHMAARTYGRVIGISSAGYFGIIGLANYAAAKSGLIAFSKSLALEGAPFGITSNVVAPHLVDSARGAERPADITATLLAQVPIKRFGTPAEIAASVLHLASLEAGYITGEVPHVKGGMEWLGPDIDMAAGLRKPSQQSY